MTAPTRRLLAAALGLLLTGGNARPAGPPAPALTVEPAALALAGLQDGRQLLVTGRGPGGRPRDLTREARYRVEPGGVAAVSAAGRVRVLGKGVGTITVVAGGHRARARVTVSDADADRPLHFANDVVPVLTRHGCNAGGCHGKASGQNGFKLSLFGFDPEFD